MTNWTPVTEKLPEMLDTFIVTIVDGDRKHIFNQVWFDPTRKVWYLMEESKNGDLEAIDITDLVVAWTEKLKPY